MTPPTSSVLTTVIKMSHSSSNDSKKGRWEPNKFSIQEYHECFMKDLRTAYVETQHITDIEEKISHWRNMTLSAECFSPRRPPRKARKTWVFLCLLMANSEPKQFFTRAELKALDKRHRLALFESNLLKFRKSNSSNSSNSWRPWSGCAHLKKDGDSYTLSWL